MISAMEPSEPMSERTVLWRDVAPGDRLWLALEHAWLEVTEVYQVAGLGLRVVRFDTGRALTPVDNERVAYESLAEWRGRVTDGGSAPRDGADDRAYAD